MTMTMTAVEHGSIMREVRRIADKNSPPPTLGEMIRLSVRDARSLDRTRFRPDYSVWHMPSPSRNACLVCDAGAVLAGTFRIPHNVLVRPSDMPHRWHSALAALDLARGGEWAGAIEWYYWHDNHPLNEAAVLLELSPMRPEFRQFQSWDEMDQHLLSMEGFASILERYAV